jgi:hypothetical protein
MSPRIIIGSNAGGGGGGAVTSVAGRTGAVVLTAADVGAGQLPSGVLLPSGVAIPSNASAATQAANDNSTKVATTAYAETAAALSGYGVHLGPHAYSNFNIASATSLTVGTAGNGVCSFVTMAETGHLRDISVFGNVGTNNLKLAVYDTGQANGTHTTSTQLAISSPIVVTPGAWNTWDPNLAVTKGDTLYLFAACDSLSTSFLALPTLNGVMYQLPANFIPNSGAGTMNPRLAGSINSAGFYASPPTTIAQASIVGWDAFVFAWRIS